MCICHGCRAGGLAHGKFFGQKQAGMYFFNLEIIHAHTLKCYRIKFYDWGKWGIILSGKLEINMYSERGGVSWARFQQAALQCSQPNIPDCVSEHIQRVGGVKERWGDRERHTKRERQRQRLQEQCVKDPNSHSNSDTWGLSSFKSPLGIESLDQFNEHLRDLWKSQLYAAELASLTCSHLRNLQAESTCVVSEMLASRMDLFEDSPKYQEYEMV